jgi:hypothetical protein
MWMRARDLHAVLVIASVQSAAFLLIPCHCLASEALEEAPLSAQSQVPSFEVTVIEPKDHAVLLRGCIYEFVVAGTLSASSSGSLETVLSVRNNGRELFPARLLTSEGVGVEGRWTWKFRATGRESIVDLEIWGRNVTSNKLYKLGSARRRYEVNNHRFSFSNRCRRSHCSSVISRCRTSAGAPPGQELVVAFPAAIHYRRGWAMVPSFFDN